jgi:GDPmannose 4,6-dehydratase
MTSRSIIISGATGQIGSYACEKYLNEGFKVYGIKRRSSSFNTERVDHLLVNSDFKLEYGDLTDYSSIGNLVAKVKPDIFLNCGAQSHVRVSFDIPIHTMSATGDSVINCLEAIRTHSPDTRFITMSSSEMFGSTPPPQNEQTPFHPRSVYAIAKLTGYYATMHYREAYNMFCSNAICFNTESPRRGIPFATRKITFGAARCKLGLQKEIRMGNLKAQRDWQHAQDTVEALYLMSMADKPDDYCVGTGVMRSVEEFAKIVFSKLNMDYRDYIVFDPGYLRKTEVDALCCDNSKIKEKLGWKPKISFEQLVDEMIANDMELARKEKLLLDASKK